jgi:hypothetical protein
MEDYPGTEGFFQDYCKTSGHEPFLFLSERARSPSRAMNDREEIDRLDPVPIDKALGMLEQFPHRGIVVFGDLRS